MHRAIRNVCATNMVVEAAIVFWLGLALHSRKAIGPVIRKIQSIAIRLSDEILHAIACSFCEVSVVAIKYRYTYVGLVCSMSSGILIRFI